MGPPDADASARGDGIELLRAFLKAMDLPIRGKKSELQQRLNHAFDGGRIETWKYGDRLAWTGS